MPIALIKCVREVSSEDSVHVAANLLNPVVSKKWKTKNAGEKSAYVILELEEPHGITGIDIGNERSAFVEVLVAKSGNSEDDFTDILITCSFMTPIESKNLTNPNRVRCFGQNALVESKLETKWQLIKVLCTQPFNKHIQYGLSFIKVHVSENTNKNTLGLKSFTSEKFKHTDLNLQNQCDDETKKIKLSVGQFYFREDSPDSDSVAGLFSRWKTTRQKKVDVSLSNAYAIREASSLGTSSRISESALKPKSALKIPCTSGHRENFSIEPHVLPDRNRVELYFGNENPSDKIPKKSQTIQILNHQSKGDCEVQERGELEYNTAITTQKDDLNSKSAGKSEQKIKFRPFNKLLDGVVVVMSGIQARNQRIIRNQKDLKGGIFCLQKSLLNST